MFGKFNAANRRLNKFNRTRGGLSKIVKIMGVTAVFIFGVGLAIALGEDDQVGGSDAKGTQFIKRVDVDEPLPETNPDGTMNGLNVLLIGRLNESYIKEYLEISLESEKGLLNPYQYHMGIGQILGINYTEQGAYNGSLLPVSYLPFENGKVVWNESRAGLPAKALTLRVANKYVFGGNAGTGPVRPNPKADSIGAPGSDYSMSAFQINKDQHASTKPSNLTGYNHEANRGFDIAFFPDQLSFLDRRATDTLTTYMNGEEFTDRQAKLISGGTFNQGNGLFSRVQLGMRNPSAVSAEAKAMRTERAKTYIEDIEAITDKYQSVWGKYVAEGKDTSNRWWTSFCMALVKERGWKFDVFKSEYNKDYLDAYRILEPEATQADFEKFIADNMGVASDVNWYKPKTSSRMHVYKDMGSYRMGEEHISLGHVVIAGALGDVYAARMLKLGGLEDVDPSNPDTYMNKFENEWVPDGTADWMREYGVDPSKVNPKRVALLNEAYKLIGTPYVYGARRPPVKNPDGSYDVKTGAFDCSSLVQYIYNTVHGIEIGSWTGEQINHKSSEEIPLSEAQPGDLVYFTSPGDSTPHHVVMYISGDLTTGGEFTYIHEPNPKRACEVSTWAYAGEKRTLRRVKGID